MRWLYLVVITIVVFLTLCFYWPTPPRTYHLMADPNWYKLDTRGIE